MSAPKHTPGPLLPWSDCKFAFDVDDDDALWAAYEAGTMDLPAGWELNETDGSCARAVAIFRVTCVPTVEDGEAVRAAIAKATGNAA